MESKDNCGVCGKPLVYGTEEVPGGVTFAARNSPP